MKAPAVLGAALALAGCSGGGAQGPVAVSSTPAASPKLPVTTLPGSPAPEGRAGGGSCSAPAAPEPGGTVLGRWQGTATRTVGFTSCQRTWGLADIWNCPSSDSGANHTISVYLPGLTTPTASFGGELGPGQGIDSWGTPEFSQVAPPATGHVSIRLSFPAGCRWQLRAVAGANPPPAWSPATP